MIRSAMRTYGDRCGIARALDVVGERWALLVVRELVLGPKRFTDLRAGLPNIGPDVLSQRLRQLEQAGIVRRGTLAPPAASRVYELTDRGRELEPVLIELGRWGSVAPVPSADAKLGPDAAAIALKSTFAGAPADFDATYELRLGDQRFRARVAGGRFDVVRGSAEEPEATIEGDPGTLASVLWHGADPGQLHVEGNRRAATSFLRLFRLPS
jgi:DNA-binding HxlR family transcriptional regulator